MEIAIAAPNDLAVAAGTSVADAGGNAVDAAVAAAVVAMCTEPGICSLPGGAYLTVAPSAGEPEVIDANVTMPGRGLDRAAFGRGTFDITTEYGGGVTMTIGHGSVATPGTPAGLALAHDRHGRMPWSQVLLPAIEVAETGFALGSAADHYLDFVHEDLYGWHPPSHAALHDSDGDRIGLGDLVVIDDLAESLRQLATEGVTAFYNGDLGARIVSDVQANDGLLTRADLAEYRPLVRAPLSREHAGWMVTTNPAPAIGGVILVAMLAVLERGGAFPRAWDASALTRVVHAQDVVLGRRIVELDLAPDREAAAARLLEQIETGHFDIGAASPSTVHVSVVDDNGGACAITASAGYGSGVMPPGTGLWLNNSLGELELNRAVGLHGWEVGQRLPSNMAPTVVTGPAGQRLAIGSPGADRITTAIMQTLVRFIAGAGLDDAISAPRVHVTHAADGTLERVLHEADLDVSGLDQPTVTFPRHSMAFGGVGAGLRHADGHLEAAADPRRAGATAVT